MLVEIFVEHNTDETVKNLLSTSAREAFLSYFFVQKIPLSRRVEDVMDRG